MSSTSKRERQKAGHRARLDAERAAFARYRRRRRVTVVVLSVGAVLVAAALVVALSRGDDDSSTTASTSSTTTTAAVESAAGKPCVALADPLPAGAPEVPVPVGEPPTELVAEDLAVGTGQAAVLGDEITVNYIGVSCSTGKIFDSSYSRGEPVTFPLAEGQLIEGWTTGIPGMQPGGTRLLVVPPDQGYGASGQGSIAPDETLVFVVALESAGPPTTTTTAP